MRKPVLAAATALACLAGGCGGDPSSSDEQVTTGFAAALERVGEGVSPAGTGYGWIDMGANPAPADVAAALGPGPADFVADSSLLRRVGIDVEEAEAATSVAASYGYGVRLDGVDGERLARLLRAEGARTAAAGSWTEYDLGAEWERPLDGPVLPLRDYAARVAIGPGGVILARTEAGRRALEDIGDSPLGDTAQAFAADCLGADVASARTLLGNHTHNPHASPEMIAVGSEPGEPARETLCAIGSDPGRAGEWVAALEASFAAGATEPLTDRPIAQEVRGAEVELLQGESLSAARAELELVTGARPGWLARALASGAVLALVGAPEPIPAGTRLGLGDAGSSG